MRQAYIKIIKPFLDFIFSFALLLFFGFIIAFLAVLLIPTTNGRPFFTQQRPGRHGKIFRLIKFRTMRDLYDENGNQLPDKYRITKIGRFIRSASLDELPQLINVLKGDMSLVGPRPLLVKYLPLYNSYQARRHEVRPGITGWTQVNGRNSLSWNEKFELDIWYIENISLLLDIKILWLTFSKVLKREGINAADAATMKPFNGNN